jgi:hypothetical protein
MARGAPASAPAPGRTLLEGDWERGIIRDLPRTAMPVGSLYDAVDVLVDEQGRIRKRGGTSYYGVPVSASIPTFVDSSSANHPIVTRGQARIDTSQKKFGDASAKFAAQADALSLDGSADFLFGTGDFTIDLQVYAQSLPTTYARLYDSRPSGVPTKVTHLLDENIYSVSSYTTTGTITPKPNALYLCTLQLVDGTVVANTVTGCGLTWVKVAEKAQGTTSGVYVAVFRAMKPSGTTQGAVTATFSATVSGSVRSRIVIDEIVGVDTSGADGAGAIKQAVTNGAGSATSLTVTLGAFAAASNLGWGSIAERGAGNGPTAGNGYTTAYAQAADGSGAITMSHVGAANPKATGTSSGSWAGIGLEIAAAVYPTVSLKSSGAVEFAGGAILTSSAVTTGAWHHIAVSRAAGTVYLFVDGALAASAADTTTYQLGTSRPMIGGSGSSEGTEALTGWVDELRVSNVARWTAAFTPPAAAYTPDANTVFLMHADQVFVPASRLQAVTYAEFPTGAQLLVTADDNHLYRIDQTSATDLGALTPAHSYPLCKPVLHVSGTSRVIIPATDGLTGPYAYTGTTLAALGGSPPPGRIAALYKARLLLANSRANPNRLWFGPLDLATTWDTANAWVDLDWPVAGMVAVRNALIVFGDGHASYLTGSVPPGTQGFDMSLAPLGDIGCVDARSIAVWQDVVIFANTRGVYQTNGAAFRSLTEPPELGNTGIGSYWRSLLSSYTKAWSIVGGVIGDFYLVTIKDSAGTLVDTLVCYLPRRAWTRIQNFRANMYTSTIGNQFELYYAGDGATAPVAISPIFTASSSVDADGTPVQPLVETRFLGSGPALKAYGFARITYDMRGGATMSVLVAPGPEATTFTAVPESPLPATTDATRKRVTINKDTQGVTFRFVQSGGSSLTDILAIELEERPYPQGAD